MHVELRMCITVCCGGIRVAFLRLWSKRRGGHILDLCSDIYGKVTFTWRKSSMLV